MLIDLLGRRRNIDCRKISVKVSDYKEEGEVGIYENTHVVEEKTLSRSGAVNDHHFSGTGILTDMFIGSMLSRQRGAGVDTKSLAGKKPVTSKAAARARAGSGSHSKGK